MSAPPPTCLLQRTPVYIVQLALCTCIQQWLPSSQKELPLNVYSSVHRPPELQKPGGVVSSGIQQLLQTNLDYFDVKLPRCRASRYLSTYVPGYIGSAPQATQAAVYLVLDCG